MVDEKPNYREVVFLMIDEERERQKELGKSDNNSWAVWGMVFSDYVGRVANELWKLTFGIEKEADTLIRAITKALAVGVAWLENIIEYNELVSEIIDGEQSETEGQ